MAKYGKSYQKSNTPSGPPNTFTARVTTPTDASTPVRYLPNCKIWNGVLVQLVAVGRGKKTERAYWTGEGDADVIETWEYYAYIPRPKYCLGKFDRPGLKEEIIKLDDACGKKQDYTECFTKYRQYMLTMGDNGNGYIVEDHEQAQIRILEENKVVSFHVHNCWETGINWFELAGRYPDYVFNAMRPFLHYHAEQEEEEGEWKGWATTHNVNDIESALEKIGWKTNQ